MLAACSASTCARRCACPIPIVSIDGLELKEFDFIDIGGMMESSGAVAVVIKSLVFPTTAGVGQEWRAEAAREEATA